MKSIGVFWKSFQDQEDLCQTCPQGKDKKISPNRNLFVDKEFEFQINLWNTEVINIVNRHQFRFRAIDFGVVCPLVTQQLVFLLPFRVADSDFYDLVKCLSLDADLLCSVFNEDLKSTSEPAKSYHKIEGSSIRYLMYELSKENIESFDYDEKSNVTRMLIKINTKFSPEEFQGYQLFVRFRLMLKSFDSFAKKKMVSNDWLQSAFSSTYLFDIRLNDVRELAKKKKELVEYNGFSLPKFKKIHFFYMADSEENVENGSSVKLDKRLLEKERWHSYLGKNLEFVSENIAHHWKAIKKYTLKVKEESDVIDAKKSKYKYEPVETTIQNFTLFFKTEFSDYQFNRLLFYVSIIVILGIFASAIVSLINCFMPKDLTNERGIWIIIVACIALLVWYILRKSNDR